MRRGGWGGADGSGVVDGEGRLQRRGGRVGGVGAVVVAGEGATAAVWWPGGSNRSDGVGWGFLLLSQLIGGGN